MHYSKKTVCAAIFTIAMLVFASAAYGDTNEGEDSGSSTSFDFGIAFGVQTFANPNYSGGSDPETYTYQSASLSPEIHFGKIGVGLDLTVNYTFSGDHNNPSGFTIRQEDWIPHEDGEGWLALYLSKIRYLSWGMPNDPLYAMFGSIPDATLGNGFILGHYTNSVFFPERRFLGLQLAVDGTLFDFPLIGVQTFVANMAQFDVFGGRFYTRPLLFTENDLFKNTQVGFTVMFDRDPYYIARTTPLSPYAGDSPALTPDDDAFAAIWGIDFFQPIVQNPVATMAAFGDFVVQNQHIGSMVGFGGKLFSFLPYTAQVRFLGANFQPAYFDRSYDLYRISKYEIYSNQVSQDGSIGWLAGTGISVFDGAFAFSAQVSGPFGTGSDVLPQLEAGISLGDSIIPGVSAEAFYQKKEIQTFSDIINPTNAVIGARINYQSGPAVISLLYDVRYDPIEDEFTVNSGLETAISLN